MKNILAILIIILVAVFLYINLNDDGNKKDSTLREQTNKQTADSDLINAEEENLPEIPDVYDFSKLTIDYKLKLVKLNLPDSLKLINSQINVSAVIPSSVRLCDLFLLVNNKKRDMFYRASSGRYVFKNVSLSKGRNKIEIFYRIRTKRSRSETSIVIRD